MTTTSELKSSQRPNAFHDVVDHRPRRPLPSDVLADQHGQAVWAALRVADARKAIETWNRIADRDRAAGHSPSSLFTERLSQAHAALADAEAAFAEIRGMPLPADVDIVVGGRTSAAPTALVPVSLVQRQSDFLASNPTAAILLEAIRANPTAQQAEWAAVIGRPRPAVSRTFEKLEVLGLVTRDETCIGGSAIYVPRRKLGRPRSKS